MPVKRTSHNNGRQDAISLLKKDHEKVKGLLNKLERAKERDRQRNIFAQIDRDLLVHTRIEEEIFYPAFKNAAKSESQKELYFEAVEEHHVVEMVLPEMRTSILGKEVFSAKAKVLKDLVEHHIKEEEKEMFPKARKVLGSQRLNELGNKMHMRKEQLAVGMWDQSLEVINPFVRRTLITPNRQRAGRTASKRRAA